MHVLRPLKFRVSLQIILRPPNHIFFAAIGQLAHSVFKRNPQRTLYLDSHLRRYFVDLSRLVTKQIEADDLENPLFPAPGAHVSVLNVAEFRYRDGGHAGLFHHLPDSRLLGFLTRVDQPFG